MKTKILSLLAIAGLLFFTGCASEDTANKQNEQKPGTEGLTSFVEKAPATRTTAEYDGSGLNFYWTAGDRLWVNNGTLIQDTRNNIASKLENNPANSSAVQRAAKANFWFNGTFTASSYPVRYTGKNGVADKVTIKASQTQTIPNDASHIGEDGDFGVATATKPTGGDQYFFTLDHKAAYATFLPYNAPGAIEGAKITKIKVSANEAIAGTYTIDDAGTLTSPSSTSTSIELTLNNNFSLPKVSNAAINAATMVIAPGTYTNFTVEYTLHDAITNITGTITKTYPSVTFTAGRNKKVKTDMQITVYPGNEFYQWDAQQQYWYGHESSQPTPENPAAPTDNSWPQSKAADPTRWYNDVMGYTDPTGTAPAVLPTTSRFQACPNVNELLWYARYGEPHPDNTTIWSTMGHLYTGGVWLKKSSKISGFRTDQAPDGTDYTRSTNQAIFNNLTITPGKPSNLNDYFYLPIIGRYAIGELNLFGSYGYYWSSTSYPGGTDMAYCFGINSSGVFVTHFYRYLGIRSWTAQ